jgi:hypothetical protein
VQNAATNAQQVPAVVTHDREGGREISAVAELGSSISCASHRAPTPYAHALSSSKPLLSIHIKGCKLQGTQISALVFEHGLVDA